MNTKKTIEILEKHNRWRKDNNVPPKTDMIDPKTLGKAIESAINKLKNYGCKTN